MVLSTIDWLIIASFFLVSLIIGLMVSARAGKSSSEFFLSGRNMPWWLLGVSMVATTFSADTPNLVTDIVRNHGVSGNWLWWAFLLTGMLTVFIYARLWRRSEVLTDVEFYELRYSGRPAAFLRGFRALYLGVFFNVLIMASVSLAAIKIGGVMLGLSPLTTILIASSVTVVYSMLGGLRGVLITDFFQFIIAMIGSIGAAYVVVNLPQVGGLEALISHPAVRPKMDFLPDFSNREALMTLLILPLAVQWWSVWYPGAEPGGGGYIAQRMLSAKNENHALGATLLFNVAHYALRPWPWLLIALASIIVYPDLSALHRAFPSVDMQVLKDDLAYPAMLTYLPAGLLGLVIASLIAAYMSTISTHLNWGASYVVNDFYKRFIKPQAPEKELVRMGRLTTLGLMILAGIFALLLSNALQAFNILLQVGAGTGLLFIIRWFWWRINPYSELTAMIVSFFVALYFQFLHPLLFGAVPSSSFQLVSGVAFTTLCWLAVTYFTAPSEAATLRRFYEKVHPGGPGWRRFLQKEHGEGYLTGYEPGDWDVPRGILMMLTGTFTVYASLFATGKWLYEETPWALLFTALAVAGAGVTLFLYGRRPGSGAGTED